MVEAQSMPEIKMYAFYRSGATWRMRLYFGYKGIKYEKVITNLLNGDQKTDEYAKLNPSKVSRLFY